MILIKPSQISGEIMTLIEEADNKLIIVSPYCKFSDWNKFLNTIKYLKRKKTLVEFYVRENESKSILEIQEIGFNPIQVPNLHTKLYINEKYAIVSSMNLLTYSDMNSLDIAYKTESKSEYDELIEYYNRYLSIHSHKEKKNNSNEYQIIKNGEWIEYLGKLLDNELNAQCKIELEDNILKLNCKNLYESYIYSSNGINYLNINGVISSKQYKILNQNIDSFEKKSGLNIELIKGYSNKYDKVHHFSKINLKSSNYNFLYKEDYKNIIEIIKNFIFNLNEFKGNYYKIKL